MVGGSSRWQQQAAEEDDELPAVEEELEDSISSLQAPASEETEGDTDFLDDRSDSEIEAEGGAVLAAEPPEELLLGGCSDADEAAAISSDDSAGASPRQQEADLLAQSGSVKAETWFKFYLEFLLLCAVRGPTWRQAVLTGWHRTEQQVLLCVAAGKVESRLLQWRSQGTLSTWVSAHNNLSKCIASLPYFTQHYTEAGKPMQRCAVCYRLREKCSGIKRFVYEGHPLKASAFIDDHTSGIRAPRQGERADSEARHKDVPWGNQQYGGSDIDYGSSSSSDDGDCFEANWGEKEWQGALRCDRYGTRRARRQRRHDRQNLRCDPAALFGAQQNGWAWTGFMPPEFVQGAGGADAGTSSSETGSDSGSVSDSGSPSNVAPISQRRWAHGPAATTPQGAAGGSSQGKEQQQRQQGDMDTDDQEAAAAAAGDGSSRRYSMRGSGGQAPRPTQSPAVQRALSLAAAKHSSTAKQLTFGAAEGGSPVARRAGAAAADGGGSHAAASAAAAAAAGGDVIEVSSTDSDTDGETLAARQQRQGTGSRSAQGLRHKAAAAPAARAGPLPSAAAAVGALADDLLDLTHTTPKRQRRRSRARCVLSDADPDERLTAPAAACQQAAATPAARAVAAAAAATGGGGGEDEVFCSPGKRTRRQRAILDDSDGDDAGAAAGPAAAAAAAAAMVGSPLKKQRHGASSQGCARQQQQPQPQQQGAEEGVINLCDSQPTEEAQDSQQQQQQQEEEEDEEQGYRRRGFLVGSGMCAARLRFHHLLQHWPYKATLLLKDAYGRCRRQHLLEQASIERAVGEVADLLYEDAYQGVEGALERMVQLQGGKPTSKRDALMQRELYDLIEAAEQALDQQGRSTFRKWWMDAAH